MWSSLNVRVVVRTVNLRVRYTLVTFDRVKTVKISLATN